MKILRKRLAKNLKEQRAASKRLLDFEAVDAYDPATDPSLVQPSVAPPVDPPQATPVIENAPDPTDETMPAVDWSQPWSNDVDLGQSIGSAGT